MAAYLRIVNSHYPYIKIPFKILSMPIHLLFMIYEFLDFKKPQTVTGAILFLTHSIFVHISFIQTRLVGWFEASAAGKQCIANILETINYILKLGQWPAV